MSVELTRTEDWKRLFAGVNETATRLYLIIEERMRARGLYDVLGDSWMPLDELRDRLGLDAAIDHRFQLAMEALRNIGTLELDGDRARVRSSRRPEADVDDELVAWTFGPLLDAYLEMYRSDTVFDPAFALAFDEGMDAIWDGLLNAPINLLPRDLAVEWIAAPGARVLDLGFGTPHTLRQLANDVGDEGAVYGIDISQHFVDRARDELDGVRAIEAIVQGDINDGLDALEDDSFDGVMFMGALHFIHDPQALFDDLARIMKRHTRLVIGTFFIDKPCYAAPGLQLHRSFFDPPGVVRSEAEVADALWRSGFELHMSMYLGSYCTLYLEQRPLVEEA